jgi:hypothetical protein
VHFDSFESKQVELNRFHRYQTSPVPVTAEAKSKECDQSSNHPRIEDLRQFLLQHATDDPESFQMADIELIQSTSLWLNRFLNCRGQTFEQAGKHAIDTFKWRKQYEVGTVDLTVVPIEGWLAGAMFIYLPDRDNLPVMYLRARMHFRVEPQFYKLLQQLIVYNFTQLDRLAGVEFGWSVLLDLTGIGWANVDLDMLYFLITTMRNHFPNGCRRIIVYGLPWFLNIVAKTVMSALPSDTVAKIKFVSGQTLPDAEPEQIVRYSIDINQNRRQERPIAGSATTNKDGDAQSETGSSKSSRSSAESLLDDAEVHLSDKQMVKKLQNSGLFEFIERQNLPDFLGGTADVNYRVSPMNAIPASQVLKKRFNYNDAQIAKTLKPFQKIIDQSTKVYETFRKANFAFEWSSVDEFLEMSHHKYIKLNPICSKTNEP